MCASLVLQVLLDEDDKERAADLAELLYETSLLTSGFALDQPKDYASKVYTLMKIALGVDLEDEPEQQPAAAAASSSAATVSTQQQAVEPVCYRFGPTAGNSSIGCAAGVANHGKQQCLCATAALTQRASSEQGYSSCHTSDHRAKLQQRLVVVYCCALLPSIEPTLSKNPLCQMF